MQCKILFNSKNYCQQLLKCIIVLDEGQEVRAVFLDILKAFEEVCQKGHIYKLKQNGISGELQNTLIDVLTFRNERVVLAGQCLSWINVGTGVPQKLFADDASSLSLAHT